MLPIDWPMALLDDLGMPPDEPCSKQCSKPCRCSVRCAVDALFDARSMPCRSGQGILRVSAGVSCPLHGPLSGRNGRISTLRRTRSNRLFADPTNAPGPFGLRRRSGQSPRKRLARTNRDASTERRREIRTAIALRGPFIRDESPTLLSKLGTAFTRLAFERV